jgi:hypothetical protein
MRPAPELSPEDNAEAEPVGLVFNDIRFGRTDGYLTDDPSSYVFPFALVRSPGGALSFDLGAPSFDPDVFPLLFARILGDESPAAAGSVDDDAPVLPHDVGGAAAAP